MNNTPKTITSALEELAAELGIPDADYGGKLKNAALDLGPGIGTSSLTSSTGKRCLRRRRSRRSTGT